MRALPDGRAAETHPRHVVARTWPSRRPQRRATVGPVGPHPRACRGSPSTRTRPPCRSQRHAARTTAMKRAVIEPRVQSVAAALEPPWRAPSPPPWSLAWPPCLRTDTKRAVVDLARSLAGCSRGHRRLIVDTGGVLARPSWTRARTRTADAGSSCGCHCTTDLARPPSGSSLRAYATEPQGHPPARDLDECRREDANDWFDFFRSPLNITMLGRIVSKSGFLWRRNYEVVVRTKKSRNRS